MFVRARGHHRNVGPAFGIAIALANVLGCQQSNDAPDAAPTERHRGSETKVTGTTSSGHARMLRELAHIAASTQKEHPYLGDGMAREFRAQLDSLPPSTSSYERWELTALTAELELYAGDIAGAIDHLIEAYELVPAEQFKQPAGNLTRFRLAVSYMRMGTTKNCCVQPMAESCIAPFKPQNAFPKQEWSKKAIGYLSDLLEDTPPGTDLYVTSRWLLNIAHMTLGGYPHDVPPQHLVPTSVFESEIDFPQFQNVALELGLPIFSLAGGAIVDDFDNDDHLDVVTSTWDTAGQMRFFRNNRDGSFTDRTEAAGLLGLFGGLNLVHADYDNDGNVDVFVLRGAWAGESGRHPNSLIRNNGDGTFLDVTFEAGLGDVHYPTQTAAWADYDNDGDLDLYVGNEESGTGDQDAYTGKENRTSGLLAPCQLFENNGDGTFTDVAERAGVANHGYTKGVVWGDYDDDRFPDLYVSNLKEPNRLYRNNGDGTFTDVAEQAGVQRPMIGFPCWFWDFDNDGVLDLWVGSYTGRISSIAAYHRGQSPRYEPACLYRGDGHGRFRDVAQEMGVARPILPMGSNFGDVNDDGYLDFYIGTGDPNYESLMPNILYLNQAGKRFTDVAMAGGFGHLQKGHSVAFADIDNDGDTDIYEEMGGAFRGDEFFDVLYVNPGFENHWLGVQLVGTRSNRSAIGARIHVQVDEAGRDRSIYRHVTSGGSFGASPLRQHIGLGKASAILRLEIFWPTTGRTQVFDDVPLDQTIQIVEGESAYTRLELETYRLGQGLESP